MNALSNTPRGSTGSLLGWLGLGNSGSKDAADTQEEAETAKLPTLRQFAKEGRAGLLESISLFLLENDLAISPENLVVAHSAYSGMNPRLERQIAARMKAGEKITQQWLNEVTGQAEADDSGEEIKLLMTRLEDQLDTFSKSTKAARTATSSYNADLQSHVQELEGVEETSEIFTSLVVLTKAMIERTRKVEDDMRRGEDEAKALRRNLERAKRDAELDHLTGLPNRRAFEAQLEMHYREAQALIEPMAVAFCDIDHFKRINDTHGHDAGDRVIKVIADSLSRISNNNCHVARHGGEEFVMLFRGLTPPEAQKRLDEVREQLSCRRLINRKNDVPFGQITFSGGVADAFAYPDPGAALRAADEALYVAKENGRNQIVLAES